MGKIIDGKAIAAEIRSEVKESVAALKSVGVTPGLAVILAGDDAASQIYVKNKAKACDEAGIYSEVVRLPGDVDERRLLETVEILNRRDDIHGILVQLPLPKHINEKTVIEKISKEKDVDAFSFENVGRIMTGHGAFLPCTPAGVIELLERSGVEIEGKNCVVVGRSDIVGKPLAMMLLSKNGTVEVCHSKTEDLAEHTKRADILAVAIGKPKFISADMVKDGAVVIDVGINRDENGKVCGDVDFERVLPKCSLITPVPGGVGPMTVAMLLKNTLAAAQMRNGTGEN
ncbi:MAG: bifunctional methylenetetrahydrofolate dehydrogenase/methenyltetrahydrofolate cyclohydrolase FolD [Clostridia bacterium]|nr:bifunctional methylenetetrahydrofolate dehydrogenase/methenyltetrahydrofolate cyclohydrolase FolD [Clostridia bacterium]